MGNSYTFQVFSENPCGLSEKAAVTKDVAHIKKTGANTVGGLLIRVPNCSSQLL